MIDWLGILIGLFALGFSAPFLIFGFNSIYELTTQERREFDWFNPKPEPADIAFALTLGLPLFFGGIWALVAGGILT